MYQCALLRDICSNLYVNAKHSFYKHKNTPDKGDIIIGKIKTLIHIRNNNLEQTSVQKEPHKFYISMFVFSIMQ